MIPTVVTITSIQTLASLQTQQQVGHLTLL